MPANTPLHIQTIRQSHQEEQERLHRQRVHLQDILEKTKTGDLPESLTASLEAELRSNAEKLKAGELTYQRLAAEACAARLAIVEKVRAAVLETMATLSEYLENTDLQDDSDLTALALTDAREKIQQAIDFNTSPAEVSSNSTPAQLLTVTPDPAQSTDTAAISIAAATPTLTSCATTPLVAHDNVIELNSRMLLQFTPPGGPASRHQLQLVSYQVGRGTKAKVWAKSDIGKALLGKKAGDSLAGALFGGPYGNVRVLSVT